MVVFTPWGLLQLLRINWEARENLESIAPSLVEWVRQTFGEHVANCLFICYNQFGGHITLFSNNEEGQGLVGLFEAEVGLEYGVAEK